MADVVDFPPGKRPGLAGEEAGPRDNFAVTWVCACGCDTFKLHADSEIECANCKTLQSMQDPGQWVQHLPAPDHPATADHTAEPPMSVIDLGDPELAVKRLLTSFKPSELTVLMAVHKEGGVQLWGKNNIETAEQLEWLKRKFAAAIEMARPRNVG